MAKVLTKMEYPIKDINNSPEMPERIKKKINSLYNRMVALTHLNLPDSEFSKLNLDIDSFTNKEISFNELENCLNALEDDIKLLEKKYNITKKQSR